MTQASHRSRNARAEHRFRFGNYEARKRGARRFVLSDPYRVAVAFTWPGFFAALIGAEILLNIVFALLYLAAPGAVANMHPGSLSDAFFFSLETLATVGYGEMYPADWYGHVVSAIEIIVGMVFVAVTTGLIFVRVSRPKPCFRYPEAIVITQHQGRPTLMIRLASDRLNVLYDAEARLTALVPTLSESGSAPRSIVDLPLLRSHLSVFALAWTLMHVIDDTSPLAGMDETAMVTARLRLFLTIRAEDATLSATVRDLHVFDATRIRFGMTYVDALSISEDNYPILDLDRIGLIQPDNSAPPHRLESESDTIDA